LLRRQFKEARSDFYHAIFFAGVTEINWKVKAVGGFILSLLRVDAEKILKLVGKKSMK